MERGRRLFNHCRLFEPCRSPSRFLFPSFLFYLPLFLSRFFFLIFSCRLCSARYHFPSLFISLSLLPSMSASCSYTSRIPVNVKYHLHFTRENIVYCSSQLLSRFHQLDSNPDTFLVFFFTEKTRVKFLHKPSVWHTFADVRFRRESVSSADDSSRLIIESSQCIIT